MAGDKPVLYPHDLQPNISVSVGCKRASRSQSLLFASARRTGDGIITTGEETLKERTLTPGLLFCHLRGEDSVKTILYMNYMKKKSGIYHACKQ